MDVLHKFDLVLSVFYHNYSKNSNVFFCDFLKYNGLPVYAMRERVNRYEIRFGNMLTLPVTYGKMFLDRKGCGRR